MSVCFEKWHESRLYCWASGKWAHISFTKPPLPPYLSLLSLKSSSVQPPSTPPSSAVCIASVRLVYYNVCEWRNGVSVFPRGSSHTDLNTTQPSSFQAPLFTPSTTIVLGLCRTALFLSTHTPTNAQRGMVITKTEGGWGQGVILRFLPPICLFWWIHQAHGIHMQLDLFLFLLLFVTTSSFLNTPLQIITL